jgi:hypothetical protein
MRQFRLFLLAIVIALVVPVLSQAAGTVVLTKVDAVPGQTVTVYTYTLTGDAANGSFLPATATYDLNGWIISVKTMPGTPAPTALWDLTLVDADGIDVMAGALADRSATVPQKVVSPQQYVRGPVTITGTNNSVNSAVIVLKITVLR